MPGYTARGTVVPTGARTFAPALLAAGLLVTATTLAPPAHASQWGCTVLLCLGNPEGPEAAAPCVEPIRQLKRHLKRGRSFPTCEEANGAAQVRKVTAAYDACPTGTSELPEGARALTAGEAPGSTGDVAPAVGIGDGSRHAAPGLGVFEGASLPPPKVCVGQRIGSVPYLAGIGQPATEETTDIYDVVLFVHPAPFTGSTYDVYVNGQPYRRVRLGVDQ